MSRLICLQGRGYSEKICILIYVVVFAVLLCCCPPVLLPLVPWYSDLIVRLLAIFFFLSFNEMLYDY